MNIRQFRRLRNPRVDDGHLESRFFFLVPENDGGLGDVVAHHGVGSPEDQKIRTRDIRDGMHILAAEGPALYPEIAGQFLGQGAVVVF